MNGLAARIGALAERQPATGSSDGQLLDAWTRHRDQDAFRQLVLRHGPMILGTCRRLLGDGPAAEDAFQVTFLVLLKQAGRLIHHDSLGGYLHSVARRTAMKARNLASRRAKHEARIVPRPITPPVEALDDALAKLPEKYRTAVVLCELEGHTRAEAARLLGIPVGTVSSRLATAHRMLTKRLGVFALPAAVVLPTSLLNAAMKLPASVPVALAPLLHEVTRMTLLKKLSAVLATVTLASFMLGAGTPTDVPKPTDKPTAKEPAKAKTDTERLTGYWRVDGSSGDFRKQLYFHFGTDGLLHTTAPDEAKPDATLTQQSRYTLDEMKKQLTITTNNPLTSTAKLEGKYDLSAEKLELHANTNGSLGILKLQRVPDNDVLQGVWRCEAVDNANHDQKTIPYQALHMLFDGDKLATLEDNPKFLRFTLDTTTTPKQLRIKLPKESGDKANESLFIYELRNNELILCSSQNKQTETPKDFKPTVENNTMVLTLRYAGPVPPKKK